MERSDQQESAAERDYGGIEPQLDAVDREAASEVGADPPGGLGADIGGSHDQAPDPDAGTADEV